MAVLASLTLLVVILFLAITGAGAFTWTLCLSAVISASAALALVVLRSDTGDPAEHPPLRPTVDQVLALLLLFLVVTVIPVPAALSPLMGSLRAQQNTRILDVLAQARTAGLIEGSYSWFSLTRNRAGTMRVILLVACALSSFLLATRLTRRATDVYLFSLLLVGSTMAVGGYIGQRVVPQGDTLWWYIPIPHVLPGPIACFVNRNHYAGFLAILAPCAAAYAVDACAGRRLLRAALLVAMFLILSAGIVFSHSRGGFIAYCAGIAVLPGLFLLRRRIMTTAFLVLCVAGIAWGVFHIPDAGFQQRLESMKDPRQSADLADRMSSWKGALLAWRAYPLLGTGANAFRTTYPQHRVTSERAFRTHPENQYVQTLCETGMVGFILAAALAMAVAWRLFRATRGSSAAPASIAAAAALAAAAAHAMFDFALHAPLYTIVLASIAGAGMPSEKPPDSPILRIAPAALALTVAMLLSPFYRDMGNLDRNDYAHQASVEDIARTLAWAPTSSWAWYYFGARTFAEYGDTATPVAAQALAAAGEYDPNNYMLWLHIGKRFKAIGNYDAARTAFRRVKELRYWVSTPDVPGN